MTNLEINDYDKLKKTFAELFPLITEIPAGLPAESHPLAVLEAMERVSKNRASKGLALAINDLLEMSMHWSIEKVSDIDRELQRSGLFTLSELRRTYSKLFKRICKRGFIKNAEEYYLIRGIIDGNYDDSEKTSELIKLISDFEDRVLIKEV